MFTTSLTAAVLSGFLASGSLETPKWETSYRDAANAAASQRKPIAVFIVAGSPGKLVKEGDLNKDAAQLLRDGFVPLTVNTATDAGRELAKSFNMTEGLVISDRTGGVQALRHTGGLTAVELKGYLTRFATATVATTEYQGTVAVAQPVVTAQPATQLPTSFQPQFIQPQPQPQYAQPQYVQPTYQPQYAQPRPVLNTIQNAAGYIQSFGGYIRNSTCPNCR